MGFVLVRAETASSHDEALGTPPAAAWIEIFLEEHGPDRGCGCAADGWPDCRSHSRILCPDTSVVMTVRSRSMERLGVADEHLVADFDTADAASLAIADVIVLRAGPPAPTSHLVNAKHSLESASAVNSSYERLAQLFAHYPGCAVAVITSGDDGGDLVGLRDGRSIWFALQLQSEKAPVARTAAVCGSLVHFWTLNGRELAALESVIVASSGEPLSAYTRFSCRVDRRCWAGRVSRHQECRGGL
jgi:hypothetical protein